MFCPPMNIENPTIFFPIAHAAFCVISNVQNVIMDMKTKIGRKQIKQLKLSKIVTQACQSYDYNPGSTKFLDDFIHYRYFQVSAIMICVDGILKLFYGSHFIHHVVYNVRSELRIFSLLEWVCVCIP